MSASMSPLGIGLSIALAMLLLWAAYRVGQIVLRILAGLLFLSLASLFLWYLFIR